MPDDPTPVEIRSALCRVLGWDAPTPPPAVVRAGTSVWLVAAPDGRQLRFDDLPDPAADLNAMAAVEKAMTPDQLWDYAAWLAGASPGERGWQHEIDADTLVRVATAPAAVRALAAYGVLMAARSEAPPTAPVAPQGVPGPPDGPGHPRTRRGL